MTEQTQVNLSPKTIALLASLATGSMGTGAGVLMGASPQPEVSATLQEIKVQLVQIDGRVAAFSDRSAAAERRLEDHEQRLRELERGK